MNEGRKLDLSQHTVIYDRYLVEIMFREKCYGATPNDPEMIAKWLQVRAAKWNEAIAKGKAEPPADGTVEAATLAQIEETKYAVNLKEDEKPGWCVFKKDALGYYLEGRVIKANLREAAVGLKLTKRAPLGCKDDIREYCTISCPDAAGYKDRIYFMKDGQHVTEIDGSEERVIHPMTPKGPISSFSRNDFILNATLRFQLGFLASRMSRPSEAEFLDCMVTAQELGYGACRSMGIGKFDLIDITVLEQHPIHRGGTGKKDKGKDSDDE